MQSPTEEHPYGPTVILESVEYELNHPRSSERLFLDLWINLDSGLMLGVSNSFLVWNTPTRTVIKMGIREQEMSSESLSDCLIILAQLPIQLTQRSRRAWETAK